MTSLRTPNVGEQLREWRQRRRLSQLALSLDVEVSTRHLSCVETGRAMPSREMLLRLARRLDVPLRARNALLVAAGFAPMFAEHALGDPALQAARDAVELILKGHEPYPALAIDRHWTLVSYNRAVPPLLAGVAPELLQPPVNVMRLALHPQGLAPRIVNLGQWRAHLLARLQRQVDATADAALAELARELRGYPGGSDPPAGVTHTGIALPLVLDTPQGTLSFIGTITVFGTPTDVTLSELALETFFPADAATAATLHATPWVAP